MPLLELGCIALAIRVWAPMLRRGMLPGQAAGLRLGADAEAALGAATRLASPVPALNKVGQEIALDLALHQLQWVLAEHIAGAANILPDALSRPDERERHEAAVSHLKEAGAVEEIPLPHRDESYWRCSGLPGPAELPVDLFG